ncbi:MAG: hypothetical protein A3K76_00710 [Euryarchaeota archaeon RBG_13_57_23]|nr:MAG: hypothetical protein A3K76_00710 [Euryarchaeota archaeon RBG_13_57_23]
MNEKVHAHLRQKDGYRFEITFDELPGNKVLMDEPVPIGRSEGPSAAMMLSSAVGHCLTSSLLFCMQKSRGAIKEIEADVDTTLARNERGRWRVAGIKVKIKPTIDSIDKEKLERCKGLFEDFCIVTASIREGVKVDVEFEI